QALSRHARGRLEDPPSQGRRLLGRHLQLPAPDGHHGLAIQRDGDRRRRGGGVRGTWRPADGAGPARRPQSAGAPAVLRRGGRFGAGQVSVRKGGAGAGAGSRRGCPAQNSSANTNSPIMTKLSAIFTAMPTIIPIHVATPTEPARGRLRTAMNSPTAAPTSGRNSTPTRPVNTPATVPTSAPMMASRLAPTRRAPSTPDR